jgi:hypothetical protein
MGLNIFQYTGTEMSAPRNEKDPYKVLGVERGADEDQHPQGLFSPPKVAPP